MDKPDATPEEKQAAEKQFNIDKLEANLTSTKEGQDKIDKLKDPAAWATAQTTISDIEDALKKLKESMEYERGSELFENEIWALNAVLEITKRKIDTDLYDNL